MIIKNILRLHKIPSKIINKIIFYYNFKNYDHNYYEKNQNKIYEKMGLDREKGIEKLNTIKKDFNLPLDREMSSEHETFFSSLSIKENFNFKKILEIGTFDGVNAFIMSKLFSNSELDTIDLSPQDDIFKNFYNHKNTIENFVKERNNILSKSSNINFLEMNSLSLINTQKKYDLIWIDGAHGYPVACIDIINSLHLINEKGIITCDDVYLNLEQANSDKLYNSSASYETLDNLKKLKLINLNLIYKRLDAFNNCLKSKRKFVGVFSKTLLSKVNN